MIRLNTRPDGAATEKIRALYELAFPPSEKKPFELILKKCDEGIMGLIAIEDGGGEFLGLAITLCYSDLLLLDYFAIEEKVRGRGIGGEAIKLLLALYPDKRFILETEDPDEAGADNAEIRRRRLGFYLRSGLSEMEYRIMLFGTQMRVLTGGRVVKFEEYYEIFTNVFGTKTAKNIYLV